MSNVHERTTCRACQSIELVEILNLGDQPPANAYVDSINATEQKYPLSLRLCRKCGMVQLGHVVDPSLLFSNYSFRTGSSRRMVEHFSRLMSSLADEMQPTQLLVEIGANDGVALDTVSHRVRVLGVDPAGIPSSVPMVNLPFNCTTAGKIQFEHGKADAIVACNVLGHIDNLDEFFIGIDLLLSDKGVLVFEVPYLGEFIDRCEWDQIYHEHLSYFSIRPILILLERYGLRLDRVDRHEVHGGSIRCRVSRGSGHWDNLDRWLEANEDWRRHTLPSTYARLERSVRIVGGNIRSALLQLQEEVQPVIGYGAPAKATVLLNACNIGTDLLDKIIDCTPQKQGRRVPGTHQEIVSPESVDLSRYNFVMIFPENHYEEIESKIRASGFTGSIITSRKPFARSLVKV